MKSSDNAFVLWYKDLSIGDVPRVGGKNAALGEMVRELLPLGVRVPNGFAITAEAYNHFLDTTNLRARINENTRRTRHPQRTRPPGTRESRT